MQADSRTRPTAVAGLFYPSDPDLLRTQVLDLLADVAVSQSMPKALIAPHAGYAYSGRVAAAAFATLRDSAQTITRVVLIGPAHYLQVRGIAGPTVDAFETPLGRVPIDVEALRKIADLPFVIQADAPHAPEYALEVELPFLQTLLGSFQLVPLVVGDAAPQDVAHVLRQLWAGLETLIVVSSDLSHYHRYEAARRLDLATAAGHGGRARPGRRIRSLDVRVAGDVSCQPSNPALGRIFPSYKKGTVPAPEEPRPIASMRYRRFVASRALLESAPRGSEQPRRGYAAQVPCFPIRRTDAPPPRTFERHGSLRPRATEHVPRRK